MRFLSCIALVLLALGSPGCESNVASNQLAGGAQSSSSYLVQNEPADAVPVGVARKQSENGQEVTLFGIIGGSSKPFVEGLAAFTIVDPKVPYCADEEGCPTPWDY